MNGDDPKDVPAITAERLELVDDVAQAVAKAIPSGWGAVIVLVSEDDPTGDLLMIGLNTAKAIQVVRDALHDLERSALEKVKGGVEEN